MKGLLVLMAIAVAAGQLDWRRNVHFALVLVVLEGAIRKWVLPGQELTIYFLKDVVLLIAYFKFHTQTRGKAFVVVPPIILGLFAASLVILCGSVLNPALSTPIVGIFGVKAYVYYVPLLWMAPFFFRDQRDFERLAYVQLCLAVPVFVLAYLQYFAPASSLLNTYASSAGESLDVATMGSSENVRVTGTFPYISGMGCFVNWVTLLAGATYSFVGRKRLRTLGLVCFCMSIIVGFMTGSRAVVFLQALLIGTILLVSRYVSQNAFANLLRVVIIIAAVGLVFKHSEVETAFEAFVQRVDQTGNTLESVAAPLVGVISEAQHAGAIGYGAGATHQARGAVERLFGAEGAGQVVPWEYEAEYPRICDELGFVGVLIWFLLRMAVTILPFYCARRTRSLVGRGICILVGIFLTTQYSVPTVFNHVFGFYFWLLAGLPLAILHWHPNPGLKPSALAYGAMPIGKTRMILTRGLQRNRRR